MDETQKPAQTEPGRHVYKAVSRVMREMSKTGIGKDQKNEAQGFKFRGIDDVLNALSRVLSESELCILPRVMSRQIVERTNARGNALFYVTLEVEFDLVSALDGTVHTVRTVGEAMDSGDKATNKAMSAAYKYACFQAFSIPTEADNDADAHTHAVAVVDITDHLSAIEASANSEELATSYTAAINACQGNQALQTKVMAAKKARIERAKKEKAQ
jgi:hypothetical protein